MTIIVCLLIIFRPRVWPEYFNLGFEAAFMNQSDNEEGNRVTVPLLNAEIKNKLFDSIRTKTSSYEFNTRDPVLVINPFDSFDSKEENK